MKYGRWGKDKSFDSIRRRKLSVDDFGEMENLIRGQATHLGSYEPLMSADKPPNDDCKHGTTVDEASPVHSRGSKIHHVQSASILNKRHTRHVHGRQARDLPQWRCTVDHGRRKHQKGHHQRDKCACRHSDRPAESAQIPWPRSEAISHEEHADEDRDGEGDESRHGSNGEEGAGGYRTGKDEKGERDADGGVKPHGIDGSLGVIVHPLDPGREWKAVVSGVRERDS